MSAEQYAAIRSTLLAAILDRLIARGVKTAPILAKHGISLDLLKNPYAHLSMVEYVGFLESCLLYTSPSPRDRG